MASKYKDITHNIVHLLYWLYNIPVIKYHFMILAGFNHWKMFLTFLFKKSLHFTITLLLRCLIRVFSSKDLFKTSDTKATRNDVFNVHVLFICGIGIYPLAWCLMLVHTVVKCPIWHLRYSMWPFKYIFMFVQKNNVIPLIF